MSHFYLLCRREHLGETLRVLGFGDKDGNILLSPTINALQWSQARQTPELECIGVLYRRRLMDPCSCCVEALKAFDGLVVRPLSKFVLPLHESEKRKEAVDLPKTQMLRWFSR